MRRRGARLGALCRLRHECRHRRCHEPVVDAGGRIKGWADEALLDAYEIERQPITEQTSRYAMNTALALTSHHSAIPDNIEQAGPEGDAVRAPIRRQVYDINVGQFCCGGLNYAGRGHM